MGGKVYGFMKSALGEIAEYMGTGWERVDLGAQKMFDWGWMEITIQMRSRITPQWRLTLDYGIHLNELEYVLEIIRKHKEDPFIGKTSHAYQGTNNRAIGAGSHDSMIEDYQSGPFIGAIQDVIPNPSELEESMLYFTHLPHLRDDAASQTPYFTWLDEIENVISLDVLLKDWDHLAAYRSDLPLDLQEDFHEVLAAFPEAVEKLAEYKGY